MSIEPHAYFGAVPFNRLLGIELRRVDENEAVVVAEARDDLKQEQGVIHGGLLTILADNAAVYLTLPKLAENERITSVEFKMNFLEAGRIGAGALVATARVIKAGKRIVVCESVVTQDARTLAIGLFTYMRFAPQNLQTGG